MGLGNIGDFRGMETRSVWLEQAAGAASKGCAGSIKAFAAVPADAGDDERRCACGRSHARRVAHTKACAIHD
jgi:hypothetical protein